MDLNLFMRSFFKCLNLFPIPSSRRDVHSSASDGVSELPNSVILEILSKLPIRSIIRCKCVCKSWYDLISDPCFTNNYLKKPPFTAVVRSDHMSISRPLDYMSLCFLEIGTKGEVTRTPFTTHALDLDRSGLVSIMGSCNGFLCLLNSPHPANESYDINHRDSNYNNHTVCIINPLSGKCTQMLPDVTSAKYIESVVYGFGFSASTNEYKVIRILTRIVLLAGSDYESKVDSEIFTVGGDYKWRCFEDHLIPRYLFPCGIPLNGVVHWIGDDCHSGFIYAFDVGTERGCRIPLPPDLGAAPANIILAVWQDNLCLTDSGNDSQVDLWTMKQYGVVESWTKYFILKRWIPVDLHHRFLVAITTLRNGCLLMSRDDGQDLVSFDPETIHCNALDVSHLQLEWTASFSSAYTPNFVPSRNVFGRSGGQHPVK